MKLTLYARKDGFRRLGLSLTSAPTVIDTEKLKLSDEQIADLKADPSIIVIDGDASETKTPGKEDTSSLKSDLKAAEKSITALEVVISEAQKANKDLSDKLESSEAALKAANDELAALKEAQKNTTRVK